MMTSGRWNVRRAQSIHPSIHGRPHFIHAQKITLRIGNLGQGNNTPSTWFSETPKYTTFRVNMLVTTVEEVVQIIETFLEKEAVNQLDLTSPRVYQHSSLLPDCVVINPWKEQRDQPNPCNNEVIVDAACGATVLRGADVFAPGVMCISDGVSADSVVDVYSDTAGKCLRGRLIPYVEAGKVFLGRGVVRMTRKQLFEGDKHPNGIAIEIRDRVSKVPRLCVPDTHGLLQNLPSILCCHVLDPRPGEMVLDMCAAPGNKTTHLAMLMQNQGKIIALDKTQKKVNNIRSMCGRFGISCVYAFVCDSTKAATQFAPSTFGYVLLDAPCSALGQRPQLVNNISSGQIRSCPALQKKLFRNAVSLLKPGGSLVYSTCTLTLEENEDIVKWALDEFPQLTLVAAEPVLGKPGSAQHGLSEERCRKVQRFGPPAEDSPEGDSIGFFIAKFVKQL